MPVDLTSPAAFQRVARAILRNLTCRTDCKADFLQGCDCAAKAADAALAEVAAMIAAANSPPRPDGV